MAILTNTAVVNSYIFPVGPSIESTSTSNSAVATISIIEETVSFYKNNTPTYVSPGGTVSITYSITNINEAPIKNITIQDSIFTMNPVSVSQVIGGSIAGDLLTFDLSLLGQISPGMTVISTVTIAIAKSAIPDSTLYDTTATAALTTSSVPENTFTRTSKGHLEVNAAIISVEKSMFPAQSKITAGNLITFTVKFSNTGNIAADIPARNFLDTWQLGSLQAVTCTNENFTILENSITNNAAFIIPAYSVATLSYSGIVVYI